QPLRTRRHTKAHEGKDTLRVSFVNLRAIRGFLISWWSCEFRWLARVCYDSCFQNHSDFAAIPSLPGRALMKNSRKLFSVIVFVMFQACLSFGQTDYTLASPNKQIEVRVRTADRIQYDVLFKGTALLQNSTLSIDVDHHTLGAQPKLTAKKETTHDGV